MKLIKIHTDAEKHVEGMYTVEEISPDDIASPTANFLEVSRNLRSFPLNTFTIGEFSKEVQRGFTNHNR
ncbi:MAG: hypothetical protein ACLPYB_12585 [Desulfobaccales bacterium]